MSVLRSPKRSREYEAWSGVWDSDATFRHEPKKVRGFAYPMLSVRKGVWYRLTRDDDGLFVRVECTPSLQREAPMLAASVPLGRVSWPEWCRYLDKKDGHRMRVLPSAESGVGFCLVLAVAGEIIDDYALETVDDPTTCAAIRTSMLHIVFQRLQGRERRRTLQQRAKMCQWSAELRRTQDNVQKLVRASALHSQVVLTMMCDYRRLRTACTALRRQSEALLRTLQESDDSASSSSPSSTSSSSPSPSPSADDEGETDGSDSDSATDTDEEESSDDTTDTLSSQ